MQNKIPLFVCEYCESDHNCHPSTDMNVWHIEGKDNGELICDECLCDKSPEEKEAGKPIQFVPEHEIRISQLIEALEAIYSRCSDCSAGDIAFDAIAAARRAQK